ncbi:MAG: serine protease [Marinilabiliales bacterium]|nr:MAG: serine protease [Marinilabiliales bacterium]
MKKFAIVFLLLFVYVSGFSQLRVSPDHYCVYFKDKAHSQFKTDRPEEFLSERAIDKRNRFNIPVTQQDLPVSQAHTAKLESLGFKVVNVSKWLNCAIVYTTDEELLEELNTLPFVNITHSVNHKEKQKWVGKSYEALLEKAPREKLRSAYKYGKGKNQIKMLNGDQLHARGFDGKGMSIAVIDNGFIRANEYPVFDNLWKNKQILGWKDFVDQDTNVFDKGAHGTSVLSIIGANDPKKFVGTAPKASFWLLRSEDKSSEYLIEEYNWVCAAEFADSVGVDVINSSLSYHQFDDTLQNYSFDDMNGNTAISTIGADIAASKGIIVVTGAGNEGHTAWEKIGAPADADSCLAIGACWRGGRSAFFSSKGRTADNRIKPDITAKGMFTFVQKPDGKYGKSLGTSLSCPVIAGMAACLWQANPELSNMEIIEIIKKSSDQYDKPDVKRGHGLPDFNKALWIAKNKM